MLQLGPSSGASETTPLPTVQPDITDATNAASLMKMEPEILRGHIPAGHIPRPVVIADYVALVPKPYTSLFQVPSFCSPRVCLRGCRPDWQLGGCLKVQPVNINVAGNKVILRRRRSRQRRRLSLAEVLVLSRTTPGFCLHAVPQEVPQHPKR